MEPSTGTNAAAKPDLEDGVIRRFDTAETVQNEYHPSERIDVTTDTQLAVTVHFNHAPGNNVIVLHHGMFHTWEHYLLLMKELANRGLRAAIIDQQTAGSGMKRNCVGLDAYRRGMEAAIRKITAESEEVRIAGYVLHSMGALIGQEMQQHSTMASQKSRQETRKPGDLQRPTVLMAPIPRGGALPVSVRTFLRHPISFIRAVLRLDIQSLAETPDQVRELFFEERTEPEVVEKYAKMMCHAPFWTYCQLVLRPLIRPWIRDDHLPKMLLTSNTDATFHERQYRRTKKQFADLEAHSINGGHDFFITNPEKTADHIASFFARIKVVPPPHLAPLAKPDIPVGAAKEVQPETQNDRMEPR